jgi:hypothetical protein
MQHVLKGALIGLIPGGVMVLLAAVFSRDEWALTVGMGGFFVAVIGAVIGGFIAYQRRRT